LNGDHYDLGGGGVVKKSIFAGLLAKPYVSYSLNDNLSFGASVKLANIAGDKDLVGTSSIFVTPAISATYKF
jgi:hypothetical protein